MSASPNAVTRWFKRSPAKVDPNLLVPPEGVPLQLSIAAVATRAGAQIIDFLLTTFAVLALVIVLFQIGSLMDEAGGAIASLLFFLIRVPYHVALELAWNGQTLGKRMLKIKVVSHEGGPLTTHALVLRNVMKEAEIFLIPLLVISLDSGTPLTSLAAFAWMIGVLSIPLIDRYNRRLGDMIAGTHVVNLPQPLILQDISVQSTGPSNQETVFVFQDYQLDFYGAHELQTLEALLRANNRETARSEQIVSTVVEKIRHKIGYADPIGTTDKWRFLESFYAAQREHLEQRQLFGDRRQDKHQAAEKRSR